LASNQLWSSAIQYLNDPFEFVALAALKDHPGKQQEFKDAGVTCFCRSFTNPLLWSHYSASHQGFAIGFDLAHPFFGRDLGLGMSFLHDVRYEDLAPSLDLYTAEDLAMAAVLTKPTCWAYEQEARLIRQKGNERFDVPADAFKEVLFGARMPAERADEIVKTLRSRGSKARFAKMRFLSEGYGVKPEWLTV
jgi:hypothetical protein